MQPSGNGLTIRGKKIQTKDEVLAELMAEHVALKKTLWELSFHHAVWGVGFQIATLSMVETSGMDKGNE
jgi:hypothetical protein